MLVKDVVYSRLGKAYKFIVITTFSVRVVIAYLLTLITIGSLLLIRRTLIYFSSKSNNTQQAVSLL